MFSRRGTKVPSGTQPTYMDLLLRGEVLMPDIDDFIDRWHDAPDDSAISTTSLAEFLGMTSEEYQLWVEHPPALRYIAAARKAEQPIAAVLKSRDRLGLAARASDQSEAEMLLQWLIERGRTEEPQQRW
jgi:hypothetical protein